MRFCQADDTRRTLLAGFHERNSAVALTAQTILERTRLFRGLPSPTIQQISALSIRRSYCNGAIVFSQADPGDALYGVVTGKIRISASSPNGREMFLNIMEPGDTFGEIALLDGRHRTATASATAPSELIIITRDHFLELLKREPDACKPRRSDSLRAHSLDERLGGRICIARCAGATGAAFTESRENFTGTRLRRE